jgi:Putative peptidoglycan binding domain
MKKTSLFSLIITAIVALASTVRAGPHGGGGGFGGGQFGGTHFGGYSGGSRAGPALPSGGARFSGNRSSGGLGRAPQQFYYYSGARTSATVPRASARQLPSRSISSTASRVAPVSRPSNRVNSDVGEKRVTNPGLPTAENRQSFVENHAFARHNGSWHRDWDKHRAHFDHGHIFVFVGGSWWGLYPWDYYPYYGYSYYPDDYSYDYPYDYSGYPYDGTDYSSSQPYSYYNGYTSSGQYSNSVVSAVQSKLAGLGYYRGAIDGILGEESEAALARYQQDQDLSVTGTVTTATLRALGLSYSGGS